MPEELDKIRRAIQRENPGMSESRTWAIATSTFKKKHGIRGKATEEEMAEKASGYIRDKTAAMNNFERGFFEELEKIAQAQWDPYETMDPYLQEAVEGDPSLKALYERPMGEEAVAQIEAHPTYKKWRQERWGGKTLEQLQQEAQITGQAPKPLPVVKPKPTQPAPPLPAPKAPTPAAPPPVVPKVPAPKVQT